MLKMQRKASDNKYLHKDFHVSLDLGLAYIGEHYGADAVREYLNDYAKSFYRKMSLPELENYFKAVYDAEGAPDVLDILSERGRLSVKISECPAMKFMRSTGHEPSVYYAETTKTLYKALADICGFEFELVSYDNDSGAAEFVFTEADKR